MISPGPVKWEELEIFDAMSRQPHAGNFVVQTGLETRRKYFGDSRVTYPGIENDKGEFCGYFILVPEADAGSVEFRRILVGQHRRGIGETALSAMESFCKNRFNVQRIWLDVYEDNEIGIHICEKMGYMRFGKQ